MTTEQKQALRRIAEAAVRSEQRTGVPAELTTAQCCLESGYLNHAPGNNPFGIKKAARHTNQQMLMTTEYIQGEKRRIPQAFAAFDSLEDAFDDHGRLISTGRPYRAAWELYQQNRSVNDLIIGVARVYATDPKYSQKVLMLATSDEVQSAIADARQPKPLLA